MMGLRKNRRGRTWALPLIRNHQPTLLLTTAGIKCASHTLLFSSNYFGFGHSDSAQQTSFRLIQATRQPRDARDPRTRDRANRSDDRRAPLSPRWRGEGDDWVARG